MARSRPITRLALATALVTAAVALSGCTSPIGARGNLAASALAPAAQASLPGPGPAPPTTPLPSAEPGQPTSAQTTDPESLQQIAAAIQALGDLDQASRDELMANLAQTDPAIRPLVTQQVRAGLALRRQAQEQPDRLGPKGSSDERSAGLPAPAGPTTPEPPGPEPSGGPSPNEALSAERGSQPPANAERPFEQYARRDAPTPDRAPPKERFDQSPPKRRSPHGPPNSLVAAAYQPGVADGWEGHLEQAIERLEAEVPESPQSDRELARHARLRMLKLAKGRRDEALRPIPALAPPMQEFWSKQFFGLATLLDPQLITDSCRRSAEAKQHLEGAVVKLGESCPLVVRNPAFVTEIQSYGTYKPFDKYEFLPGQRVLLYAEVENFESNETPKGFYTATRSSYQIFDASGKRVAEHEFSLCEEYCRRPRRDFFIAHDLRLPQRLYPGKHVLQLTVADLNSEKIGQTVIEFTVKSSGD